MGIKSFFLARKFIAIKPVVFITGFLTLFIMANAYSLDKNLYIDNLIPSGNPHYSKSGYTLKPSGHGHCMYGVYNPASCASAYDTKPCYVVVHYASSLDNWCSFKPSYQDFNIINNDTGKIVASFQWYINGARALVRNIKDYENITADVTGKYPNYWVKKKVNICAHRRG
ncbi:hypothetical protein [Candidatus Sororendozoicomonas aggregata]|uniref:hypothetical protein n=1 Tax=Candidatus Sororendozoicomonas aggregata TaxID=3073239 RepID=UPI002ED41E65